MKVFLAANCGGRIGATSRNLSYMEWPSPRDTSIECEWEIHIPFGMRLKFIFEYFLLLAQLSDCSDLFFEIEDLAGVRRFCQSGPSSRSYLASGLSIRARLFSQQTRNADQGFYALLEYSIAPCHAVLTNFTYATIFSPYYPDYYPNDKVCTWKLRVSEDSLINVDCTRHKFWIENSVRCASDVLLISRTGNEYFTDGISFCGRRPPPPFTSLSNVLTFLFKSDPFYHYNGFRCDFIATIRQASSTTIPTVIPPTDPNVCGVCGVANDPLNRVIGGFEPKANQYPWIVAIFESVVNSKKLRQICGGSLINDRYVLSAAHCFQNKLPADITVDLGEHNIQNGNSSRSLVPASQLLPNPDWTLGSKVNNDIAIVKLARSVQYSSTMRPICLPPAGYSFQSVTATVAGWGRTQSNSNQSSSILMAANVTVLPLFDCRLAYGPGEISQNVICAAGNDPRKDACPGDSGGPLMWFGGDRWYLIGVVSAGASDNSCGNPRYPGIYTRVGNYLKWIRDNTKSDSNCSVLRMNRNQQIKIDQLYTTYQQVLSINSQSSTTSFFTGLFTGLFTDPLKFPITTL